jgi:hypothetical protein
MNASTKASIKWWAVYWEDGKMMRIRRRSGQIGFGWDATCSCGWDSRTGGAVRRSVQESVLSHKIDHELGFVESAK